MWYTTYIAKKMAIKSSIIIGFWQDPLFQLWNEFGLTTNSRNVALYVIYVYHVYIYAFKGLCTWRVKCRDTWYVSSRVINITIFADKNINIEKILLNALFYGLFCLRPLYLHYNISCNLKINVILQILVLLLIKLQNYKNHIWDKLFRK